MDDAALNPALLKMVIFGVAFIMATILGVIVFPLIPALRDIFRGGPRPPSHPIPGDDSRLLNRKRLKSATHW